MDIHKETEDIRAHKFYTVPSCIRHAKCRTGKLERKVFQQTAFHYLNKTNIFAKVKWDEQCQAWLIWQERWFNKHKFFFVLPE